MGIRIHTNVMSLTAQNGLKKSSKLLNQSLTRLSTGLRINSAKDDVVGMSRSELLRSKVRAMDQSLANISNGKATLEVAEGVLANLTEIAQEIHSLAVQAADDTISTSDRDTAISALTDYLAEYSRQSRTQFNGTNLLDGSFIDKGLFVGVNEGDLINVNITDARSSAIGKVAIMTASLLSAVSTHYTSTLLNLGGPSGITIAGKLIASSAFSTDGVSYADTDESALAYVNAINSYTATSGVTAQVIANVVTFDYSSGATLDATMYLVINGVTVKSSTTSYASSDADVASVVSLINAKSGSTGVTATQDSTNDKIVLTASDGRNIDIAVYATASSTVVSSNVFGFTGGSQYRSITYRGGFKLIADEAFSVSGATAEFGVDSATFNISDTSTLNSISFATAENASTAITIIEAAIEQLQSIRSNVGSTLTRLDFAESELSARQENFSAADSSIRDADIAAETAKYTQASILQQVGSTVLAQANAAPAIVLTLLQDF